MKRAPHLFLLALTLAWAPGALASTVIDGREWRQLTETEVERGLSWASITKVCDPASGVCKGSLDNVDYTGWTWASIADVNRLFGSFGIKAFIDQKGPTAEKESNSEWAPKFFELFKPTSESKEQMLAQGWARDGNLGLARSARVPAPYILNMFSEDAADVASTDAFESATTPYSDVGAWLYRTDPAAIPEPSTYALMIAGLGLLGFAARRRRRA